ncbi:hypothetical protein [Nostoc sp.]
MENTQPLLQADQFSRKSASKVNLPSTNNVYPVMSAASSELKKYCGCHFLRETSTPDWDVTFRSGVAHRRHRLFLLFSIYPDLIHCCVCRSFRVFAVIDGDIAPLLSKSDRDRLTDT